MSKLFQIYEDDLAELERTLPEFMDAVGPMNDPRLKTQLRRVKSMLSDVRWNYGPHDEVQRIDLDDLPEVPT